MKASSVAGRCLCGAVRFTVEMPTAFCVHCHCSMCRLAHGAGYVTWIGVPSRQLEMTAGHESLARYRSSDHGSRSFCRTCGSSLFCESSRHPDLVDIVLACLEGPIDRRPQAHIYFGDRIDWVPLDDELPRIDGSPT